MEGEIDQYINYHFSGSKNHEQGSELEIDRPPRNEQEFIEILAISYIKLAFIYVEEIEKPISIMKKMIRKSLKPGKKEVK